MSILRAYLSALSAMFALQPEMKVFSGSANRELAERICKYIGMPLGQGDHQLVPGRRDLRQNRGERARPRRFLIQPTSPPTNEHLMELLIMVDACRRASADRITAVIPFFGYARQDRKDQPRVPITAKLVANLIARVRREPRADDGSARATGAGLFRYSGRSPLFPAGVDQVSAARN